MGRVYYLRPFGILFGWIAWPFLWYVTNIITWCGSAPGAYITYVSNLNSALVWGYYGLLAFLIIFILAKWPHLQPSQHGNASKASHGTQPSFLSRRTLRLLQVGAALVILLATGTAALANHSNGQLTITFLDVGPANQIAQGEAVLMRTADGKQL